MTDKGPRDDHPDLDALRMEFGERLGAIEAKIDAMRAEFAALMRAIVRAEGSADPAILKRALWRP